MQELENKLQKPAPDAGKGNVAVDKSPTPPPCSIQTPLSLKRKTGEKVKVTIISARPKGGYAVQEEGRQQGALTLGNPPQGLQEGEYVEVEILDDDSRNPQYRWPSPAGPAKAAQGHKKSSYTGGQRPYKK